jgi:hypothetical protein
MSHVKKASWLAGPTAVKARVQPQDRMNSLGSTRLGSAAPHADTDASLPEPGGEQPDPLAFQVLQPLSFNAEGAHSILSYDFVSVTLVAALSSIVSQNISLQVWQHHEWEASATMPHVLGTTLLAVAPSCHKDNIFCEEP